MSLGLLHPWFLLGALAVAAPLWLHLRRKPLANLVRFSALRFLEDSPQPQHSPRQLRHWLLFALRVLAVMAVTGAFAWPYWREAQRAVVKESRVYLLDNTLSHQANGGFLRDRDRILADLAQAGPEVQTAVVELTSQPRVVVSFGDSREEAARQLQALTPSHQRGAYLVAFRQANALFANSLGERRRIIFLSDHQENQWLENLNTPPFLQGVEVELPKIGPTNAPNLALSEPRLQRLFLGDRSVVNCSVNLIHSGPAASATVTLRSNDQLIFNRTVELQNQPETLLLQAQWEADPALWLRGEAALAGEPDALAADNRAFFTLPPVREGQVAMLAQSPYLRLALGPDIMRGHWVTRLLDPAKLTDELTTPTPAEVLVVESGYLQSADVRTLVGRYLREGRGVFMLVNRLTPPITGALRELGFEVQTRSATEPPASERLQYFLSNHPIFHPFLAPDFGNLLEVKAARVPIQVTQGFPLLFSESGEPLFFQGTRFPGRLFVAAFGLEREQTTWPLHVSFIPFLDLCLQNSRPAETTPLDYEPGATTVLGFAGDSPVGEVVLRDGSREITRAPVVQGKARLRLPDPPGLYELTYDAATAPERVFSVNPPVKESRLSYVASPEALRLWQVASGKASTAAPPAAAPAAMSRAAIQQQQLWWWLVLGALTALVVEACWTSMRKELV